MCRNGFPLDSNRTLQEKKFYVEVNEYRLIFLRGLSNPLPPILCDVLLFGDLYSYYFFGVEAEPFFQRFQTCITKVILPNRDHPLRSSLAHAGPTP